LLLLFSIVVIEVIEIIEVIEAIEIIEDIGVKGAGSLVPIFRFLPPLRV
jgi:hypothetical protein